jgi:hypothetical protein
MALAEVEVQVDACSHNGNKQNGLDDLAGF